MDAVLLVELSVEASRHLWVVRYARFPGRGAGVVVVLCWAVGVVATVVVPAGGGGVRKLSVFHVLIVKLIHIRHRRGDGVVFVVVLS